MPGWALRWPTAPTWPATSAPKGWWRRSPSTIRTRPAGISSRPEKALGARKVALFKQWIMAEAALTQSQLDIEIGG